MTESSAMLVIVLALGVAIVLLVWSVLVSAPPIKTRMAIHAFWCPFRDRNVVAMFREDPWDGRRIEVETCSAFDPRPVDCEQNCLELPVLPPARRVVA